MLQEKPIRSKLFPRGREGLICGYTDLNKLYQVYLKDTQEVKVSRDVIFPGTSVGRELVLFPEAPTIVTEVLPDFKSEESKSLTGPSTNLSHNETPEICQEERVEGRLLRGNVEAIIPTKTSPTIRRYPACE